MSANNIFAKATDSSDLTTAIHANKETSRIIVEITSGVETIVSKLQERGSQDTALELYQQIQGFNQPLNVLHAYVRYAQKRIATTGDTKQLLEIATHIGKPNSSKNKYPAPFLETYLRYLEYDPDLSDRMQASSQQRTISRFYTALSALDECLDSEVDEEFRTLLEIRNATFNRHWGLMISDLQQRKTKEEHAEKPNTQRIDEANASIERCKRMKDYEEAYKIDLSALARLPQGLVANTIKAIHLKNTQYE